MSERSFLYTAFFIVIVVAIIYLLSGCAGTSVLVPPDGSLRIDLPPGTIQPQK